MNKDDQATMCKGDCGNCEHWDHVKCYNDKTHTSMMFCYCLNGFREVTLTRKPYQKDYQVIGEQNWDSSGELESDYKAITINA